MIFSLDVIRARKGDCLILHYGSSDDPHLIMIDGGPKGVYTPHLKPRILQIKKDRGLGNDESLPVDLLMVSHVDDDHIQGILELTNEMITAQMNHQPQLVQIFNFWHNSFENIIGNTPKELTASFSKQFGEASMGGDPPNDLTIDPKDEDLDEKDVVANIKVLASIKQGAQLRTNTERLQVDLNTEFDGDLILAKEGGEATEMENGLQFIVIGPMLPELKALHAKHQAWLKELQEKGMTAEDALSAYVDKSVPNLSSIVVLAKAGDKSMLLTGDARGDKVLEGLQLLDLFDDEGKLHVDLLKVPHHGSSNNLEKDFFEKIIAKHYVFSGNGEHGNPERESLEMLLAARGDDEDYEVHLTYPIDEVDEGREEEWNKQQAKEINKQKKNPNKEVREDWDPQEHSIASLLEDNPEFAKKFRFVGEDEPHLITLLEDGDPD